MSQDNWNRWGSEDESGARQAGADAFLLKPVSPRALATALLAATRRAGGANS